MDEKRCPRCKRTFPLTEFYKTASWCKECMLFNTRRYMASEKGQQQQIAYRKSDARRESLSIYNNGPKRKATAQRYQASGKANEHNRAYTAANPDWKRNHAAHALARAALKRGEIQRGPCCYAHLNECLGVMQMHHDDYTKPLDIRWVCRRHHTLIGLKKLKEPRATYTL